MRSSYKLHMSKVRGKNKSQLIQNQGKKHSVVPKYELKFNIVETPDQQQAPSFARDEQKASLGGVLTVVKYEI